MSAKEKMDEILEAALQDMIALSGADALEARLQQAYDALDAVIAQAHEDYTYRSDCKNKLAQLQFDIGAGQRRAALDTLVSTSKALAAASSQMNKAAAENILARVAEAGNDAAEKVATVAERVKALSSELKKLADGDSDLDAETLSEKINTALDDLSSLKSL